MTKLGRRTRTATILSLLVATLGMACAPAASLASATPASPGFAPRAVPQLVVELPATQAQDQVAPQATEAEQVATELRRVSNKELNRQLIAKAVDVQSRLRMLDYGAEESFDMDGKHYVGRLERHYHTPGGELKPWGWHKGTSLYVEVPAS
jgi:hypothetical protein